LTDNQRTIAGRYQVKDLIGRGGMADVFEGIDNRLGRVVAIKILRADLAADSTFEARFRQEAQASARMAHPTIVRIYDAGEEQLTDTNGNSLRRPYIVMEYVRGQVLRDVINGRQLEIREAVSYAEGVLTALEVSHRAGVIHRDIKSANIMITETGQIKVMDFGIARAMTDSSATQAHTGGIVGTAQYFSPEQAKGETVDSRTDLYSTGVLLYEMLTGRPPFRGETAVSVAYQHVSEPVIPPSQINPNLSPELDSVVLKALAKDRDERFQSAEQFREHLAAALNVSLGFVASQTAQPVAVLEPVPEVLPEPVPEVLAEAAPEPEDLPEPEVVLEPEVLPVPTETPAPVATPPAAVEQAAPEQTAAFGFDDLLNAAVEEAIGTETISPSAMPPVATAGETSLPSATSTASGARRQPEHDDPDSSPYFYETHKVAPVVANTSGGGEHTNPFESIGVEFEAQVESDSRTERKYQKAHAAETGFAGGLISGPKTKTKSVLWGVISGFVVILLGLGIWSISTLGSIRVNVPTSGTIAVPDVAGKTYDEALATLTAANLLVTRTFVPSDTAALDSVISIDPPAGTGVLPHTTIQVYVSGGKSQVKVPYLVNTQETNANTLLTAVGLTLGQITQQNSVSAAKGTIISSSPMEYTLLPKGTPVDLVVSTGKVTVPSVIQQSVTTAKALLTGSDVGYTVDIQASTGTCTGTLGLIVTGQSIAAGDGPQAANIVLYVDCVGGTGPSPSASPSSSQ
jgi:serine/threonine-protein kinase